MHAARFDFGISYQFKQPVADLIGARMPATLELALVASILALAAGVPMGVYTALQRDSALARLFQALSLIGISLPTFLIGILLIYLFAVVLGWLPSFGRGDVVRIGSWWTTGLLTVSGLKSLIMPSITLALFQMTLIMRLVRAEMLEVLRSDYIRFARARGLSERAVHFRHALKNTLIPVITVVGLQLGSIVAFSIITETVFAWPGMGQLFLQSMQNADVPIMAAYLLLIASLFVVINLVVDLLYAAVDPRLRAHLQSRARLEMSEIAAVASGRVRIAPDPHGAPQGQRSSRELPRRRRSRSRPARSPSSSSWRRCSRRGSRRPTRSIRRPTSCPTRSTRRASSPAETRDSCSGTDDQGRDLLSAILYGLRVSLADRLLQRRARRRDRRLARARSPGYAGGWTDSIIMRIADVQLTFPAILIALLLDGVAHALLKAQSRDQSAFAVLVALDRPLVLGAIRAHGARLDDGREEPRLRAGRAADRAFASRASSSRTSSPT